MCDRCPGLVAELIAMDPDHLTDDKAMSVLWNQTAYPFNSFDETAEQAREFVAGVVAARQTKET